MLDQHPDLAIPPESYFPVSMRPRRVAGDKDPFDGERFTNNLLVHPWFQKWKLDASAVLSAMERPGHIDYPEAIRRVYGAYAESRGKRDYGDKTPSFVLHIDLLSAMFPESLFVHIIRDGRDVVASILERRWGSGHLTTGAATWAGRVDRGRACGLKLGADRYREVMYESLVSEPRRILEEICDFLGIAMVPEMLNYYEHFDELVPQAEREQFRHLSRPPTAGLRDWRRDMRPSDVATIEAVAGRTLSELGYERAFSDPPTGARIRAAAGAQLMRARRTKRRIKKVLRRAIPQRKRGNASKRITREA